MTAVVPLPQRKGGGGGRRLDGSICNRRDLLPHGSLGWLAVVSCGWLLIAAGPFAPSVGTSRIPHRASPPCPRGRGQTDRQTDRNSPKALA